MPGILQSAWRVAAFTPKGRGAGMNIGPENRHPHVPGILQSAWHVAAFTPRSRGTGMNIGPDDFCPASVQRLYWVQFCDSKGVYTMNFARRAIYLAARIYWTVARPLTLGVRVIMLRGDEVLLVKHTYQNSWYFPGGLVERGETLEEAVRREAYEEVGATLGPLTLLGIFSNFDEGKADHITVFRCAEFTLTPTPNSEIERFAFFKLTDLPPISRPARAVGSRWHWATRTRRPSGSGRSGSTGCGPDDGGRLGRQPHELREHQRCQHDQRAEEERRL